MSDTTPRPSRNPNWSRDELILALDLYRRHNGRVPSEKDPEVIALSALLNRLQRAQGANSATLRNTNGIGFKLLNFRRFDPAFADRAGLPKGGSLEPEVWADFADDPARLATVAAMIRARLEEAVQQDPFGVDTGEMNGVEEAVEGRALTVLHLRRERCAAIVASKKKRAMRSAGRLACEACALDYAQRYGERGRGFIECHHTRPVSELADGEITRLEDLALVCASCHRMIHARRPWLTVEQLRALMT